MTPVVVLVSASTFFLLFALAIMSICIISALENDSPGWATFTVFAFVALIGSLTDFLMRYPLPHISFAMVILFLVAYIVCGVVWSFFKWYLELSERREKWDEFVAEYRRIRGIPNTVPLNYRVDTDFADYIKQNSTMFTERFSSYDDYKKRVIRVVPEPNKTRMIGLMVYWPWSLLWSIFDDFITGIFKWVYRQVVGVYGNMARWMFQDVT